MIKQLILLVSMALLSSAAFAGSMLQSSHPEYASLAIQLTEGTLLALVLVMCLRIAKAYKSEQNGSCK